MRGTHNEYLERQREFEAERSKLAKKFGFKPTDNDVKWAVLTNELIEHASNGDWDLYRNTKLAMAEILRKEVKLKSALSTYLEVCYLDLNGPNNSGIPFSIDDAFLYDGVLYPLSKLVTQLKLKQNEIQTLFEEVAESMHRNLNLPVFPEQAWKELGKRIFEKNSEKTMD